MESINPQQDANRKEEEQKNEPEISFDFLEDTIISGPTCLIAPPTKDA
jgi:hypothetical protein